MLTFLVHFGITTTRQHPNTSSNHRSIQNLPCAPTLFHRDVGYMFLARLPWWPPWVYNAQGNRHPLFLYVDLYQGKGRTHLLKPGWFHGSSRVLLVDFKGHLQYTLSLTGSLKRLCFKTHHAGSKVLICRKAVGWLTKGDLWSLTLAGSWWTFCASPLRTVFVGFFRWAKQLVCGYAWPSCMNVSRSQFEETHESQLLILIFMTKTLPWPLKIYQHQMGEEAAFPFMLFHTPPNVTLFWFCVALAVLAPKPLALCQWHP